MLCRKTPPVCTKSRVRGHVMLYPKLHSIKSPSRFVVPTSWLQPKPGRWQLQLLQGPGEALTCSPGLVWDLCLRWERQWCGASWSLTPKLSSGAVADLTRWISRKAYFSGAFGICGWNWKRIHLQLNPIHQDNQKTWASFQWLISSLMPDCLILFINSTCPTAHSRALPKPQHLRTLGKGDKLNDQKFWSQFWICPGWDGKWVGKSWDFGAVQSLAIAWW